MGCLWGRWGIAVAGIYQAAADSLRISYSDASQTGFAGVVLVGDFVGDPQAYDLSCPVEVKRDVRISIDPDQAVARCAVCGSTYDVFRQGAPLWARPPKRDMR